MSKFEKLKDRLLSEPKDFTFDELATLLKRLGYALDNKGKTSGSRVGFVNHETNHRLKLHKPHPLPIIKSKALENIISELKKRGYFDE